MPKSSFSYKKRLLCRFCVVLLYDWRGVRSVDRPQPTPRGLASLEGDAFAPPTAAVAALAGAAFAPSESGVAPSESGVAPSERPVTPSYHAFALFLGLSSFASAFSFAAGFSSDAFEPLAVLLALAAAFFAGFWPAFGVR